MAIPGGMVNTPSLPVPKTRAPRPSMVTSPVHRYIIDRVALVSRRSFASYLGGFEVDTSSLDGSAMVNGTFCALSSISCNSISRDSNLYDSSMDSFLPSRDKYNTQSCVLSGG